MSGATLWNPAPTTKLNISEWARDMLACGSTAVIVDTETTGTGPQDEIIQLAIIDMQGVERFCSLIRPVRATMHPIAEMTHGISMAQLANAPTFAELWQSPKLRHLLDVCALVAYNADFDRRLLYQTAAVSGLQLRRRDAWHCVMRQYAKFRGVWNRRRRDYKSHKLTEACRWEKIPVVHAHTAAGDCHMTLALIRKMAQWYPAPTRMI